MAPCALSSLGECIILGLVKGPIAEGVVGGKSWTKANGERENRASVGLQSINVEELVSVAMEVVNERAAHRAITRAADVKGQGELLTCYHRRTHGSKNTWTNCLVMD